MKLANDGLIYVCDRINDRIQVFKKDGTFVKEWFYEKNTLGNGAVWDIAIWPDAKQTYLIAVDAKGNVYTAEVDNAKRIQKFKLTSNALP